jgi:CDP-diacylglycerol--glycerol-3-phosphate 3-phosphatidyltransferase
VNYDLWLLIIANGIIVLLCLYFAVFVYPHRELSEETKRRPRSFVSNAFFREFWYFIMEPLKKRFLIWDVSPNTITSWGLFFSIAAGIVFGFGQFGLGGWFVLLASTCDVYDGMLARAKNITLKSGAFFDSTLDRVGEAAMFAGLLWFFKNDLLWFAVILLAHTSSQIVSYCRARAEGLGFDKGGSRGFFQRAERMIVLTLCTAVAPLIDLFTSSSHVLVKIGILFICVGSMQTALSRSFGIYREMRATETTKNHQ